MLTRWWGACRMKIFFICFVFFFTLPSLGTARWQSSSSAVLFIHSSYLMGILLPSFKEAMCLRNDTRDKRKLLFRKLNLGRGARGQQCVCVFVRVSVHGWQKPTKLVGLEILQLQWSKAVGERLYVCTCVCVHVCLSVCTSNIPSLFSHSWWKPAFFWGFFFCVFFFY